ncbi:MAG: hypothetical protein K1X64_21295 [Myxococcaceae bacterium]|nr:hypothetical protein [Myxococcaceae bacterium]
MINSHHLRAFFAATCLASSAAVAAPTTLLIYEREPSAESCPPQAEFARVLATKVPDLSFSDLADETLQIQFSREQERFLAVAWFLREGRVVAERRVAPPGTECRAAFDAIAFSVAVALLAQPERRVPLRATAERGATTPVTLPASPLESTRPSGLRLALGGHGSAGTSFGPTGGPALETSWRYANWLIGAGLSQEVWTVQPHQDGLLRGGLTTGSLHACYLLTGPLRGCGVATLGSFYAHAERLPEARTVRSLYLAAGPRLDFEAPFAPRWAVIGSLDLLASFTRTRLTVADNEVWVSPPVAGRLFIGIATSFGDGFLRPPQ